jgi:hypothetical protein
VDSTVYREKPDMARLFRQRHLSDDLNRKMDNLRRETISLSEHPKQAEDIGLQLKRMLPEQGYLTERMAELRSKAHRIRNGHIGRLEETKKAFKRQPTNVKKKASLELIKSYKQLAGMDNRLQRLDNAVAQTEIRIKKLTEKARKYLAENQHKKLYECIKQAEKLQKHNSRLFNIIERTENKLSKLAKNTALQVKQNGK